MVRAIVGLELQITRLEAKRKLSQNRSRADVDGVIKGLGEGTADERAVAAEMRIELVSERDVRGREAGR